MKQIFWMIQQLKHLAGTEVVTINLINELVNDYQITILCTSEEDDVNYQIDPRVKIIYLGVPSKIVRFDETLNRLKNQHHYLKCMGLCFSLLKYYFFCRKKYRQKVLDLTSNDSLIICSSMDNYIYAPKGRKVIFHYHFNAQKYFSLSERFLLSLARKPDQFIFLSSSTLEQVKKRKPQKHKNSTYILNPCRFKRELNLEYHHNRLIFIGRLEHQKNPLLALKVAKALKELHCNFTLDIFGTGSKEKECQDFIIKENLSEFVTLKGKSSSINEELRKSDLLLLTSLYEGLCLAIIEANSLSVPVITSSWGDACEEMINQKCGYIIDSNDPKEYAEVIKSTLNSIDMLQKLKQDTYQEAQKYEIEEIIEQWIKILSVY